MSKAERLALSRDPFAPVIEENWGREGRWPAQWVAHPDVREGGVAYRLRVEGPGTIHLSGDERYELYVDGEFVGRGPERGDEDHWAFESYQIGPGTHWLVALVWTYGELRAYAQHSVRHGFVLASEGGEWHTGVAPWEAKPIAGVRVVDPGMAWGTGGNVEVDGAAYPFGIERGEGDRWAPVVTTQPALAAPYESEAGPCPLLVPAALPAQHEADLHGVRVRHARKIGPDDTHSIPIREAENDRALVHGFESLVGGRSLTVPAGERHRYLLDLHTYACARPEVTLTGLGSVRVHWQEGLMLDEKGIAKGNRDEIEGKFFTTLWTFQDGIGDRFIGGGTPGERFTTPWWQAGRYVEVVVEGPITLERFALRETRYPLEDGAQFRASDPRLEKILPLAVRTLQMCAHETYMDCPYFEQLQYIGDTRLQALVTYAITADDRLPRQALRAFDRSRRNRGVTMSRYPSRVRQTIPTFALWFVCMVEDFARFRNDAAFVRDLLPGARAVMDDYARYRREDGLYDPLPGWNFVDWVPTWNDGTPPGGDRSPCAPIQLQILLALQALARLEERYGRAGAASDLSGAAGELARAIRERYWRENRLSDDLEGQRFSEHAQALGLLAGVLAPEEAEEALQTEGLAQTTIYFTHYLFEAYREMGRTDLLLGRLGLWHGLVDNGLRTTIEMPEPTRSDCHAWGAHPYYHFLRSILGIAVDGDAVTVRPQLGGLEWAEGTLIHPRGPIRVRADAGGVRVELPKGVTGHSGSAKLIPGVNEVRA